MSDPIILSSYDGGRHNADLDVTVSRLDKEASWKDLSTIMLTPTGNSVPMRVVAAWENMIVPPNNRFVRLTGMNMEVGESYTRMIESILAHPDLSTWKYILCREHDNAMPPDGFVQLARRMEDHPEYAAIGGLYYTKGPSGVAQVWGDPKDMPMNFRPQKPDINGGLVECNGTGMGFTLFRLSMFKDDRLRRPWFKTVSNIKDGVGTQDLYAFNDFRKHGYRCAIDCSVKVGHWDQTTEIMW
jgi:hypothetical protein